MRAALDVGLPVFGSCWGVQIAAALAGGCASQNPCGPEYGFARAIMPTQDGQDHPLLAGRPAVWDAPAIHSDAVLAPPPGSRVLAGNRLLGIQALEIRRGAGWFWGTQYHPEHDFDALATMLRLSSADIVEAGLAEDAAAVAGYADQVAALSGGGAAAKRIAWQLGLGPEVLDSRHRRREIGNFLVRIREQSHSG
jgi:GMP synthase (glutamine-hydrolysing)